jgi:toxoflavin biosynthesis protein ToxD
MNLKYDGKTLEHPISVIYDDAVAYCIWASEKLRKHISIPTESQWEKAARGTDGRKYPWGNYWDNLLCSTIYAGSAMLMPVGSYPDGQSPYGCLDMSGNIGDFCLG